MTCALNISATDRLKIAAIIMENEDFAEALYKIGEYFVKRRDFVYGLLFSHMAMNATMYGIYCGLVKPHTDNKKDNSDKHVTFVDPTQKS